MIRNICTCFPHIGVEYIKSTMTLEQQILDSLREYKIGYTSAPSTNTNIEIDIWHTQSAEGVSQPPRVLGEMVITAVQEAENVILAIGQIVNIRTENKWHSDITFKGVVKQFGTIPHLSGNADVRIASVSVQSSFVFKEGVLIPYVLGVSPSTGEKISVLTDQTMNLLMENKQDRITYLGRAYGAQVSIPFWFKHFGKDDEVYKEYGSGDAYHIGVFGKTGSGKTVMSSMMLAGYAKNKNNMSILILDPQAQFYRDKGDLLPGGQKFETTITDLGMQHHKYQLTEQIYLSDNHADVLPRLLLASGFVKHAFAGSLGDKERKESMAHLLIGPYISKRMRDSRFSLRDCGSKQLLVEMLENFIRKDKEDKLGLVYVQKSYKDKLRIIIERYLENLEDGYGGIALRKWEQVLSLYKESSKRRTSIDDIVTKLIEEKGHCIVLSLASKETKIENENLQALFINLVQQGIIEKSSAMYEQSEEENIEVNALVVMDEAHRFASENPFDPAITELSRQIVDAVRTTRKYGVGYMFITQSLDSLHEDILRQMRIFSFGHGLTTGTELRRVREIINNDSALGLYRSFIDPGSNGQYPFMFFGPASPLSFTGAPVFIEAYKELDQFEKGLRGEAA